MKNFAFIFPGQGAQYVGMGKDFFDTYSVAKETFQEADDLLSSKLSNLIFEGPIEELTLTKNAQTAIYVTSIAMLRVLEKQFPSLKPTVCAGLSLGEYTALCAASKISFRDGLSLVKNRAAYMNDACEKTSGTMAAVLGMDGDALEEALKSFEGASAANFNCPGQIVISGTKSGIEKAAILLKEKGAKKIIPLQVHGAFHSILMEAAKIRLEGEIQSTSILESSIDIVMNVPGDFVHSIADIKKNLISQVTSSVRWEKGIRSMEKAGFADFIEIGPGKTLSGFNKKMNLPTISVEKISDLETLAGVIA